MFLRYTNLERLLRSRQPRGCFSFKGISQPDYGLQKVHGRQATVLRAIHEFICYQHSRLYVGGGSGACRGRQAGVVNTCAAVVGEDDAEAYILRNGVPSGPMSKPGSAGAAAAATTVPTPTAHNNN